MTAHAAIRLGTRSSLLARTQAGWVADRLRAAGHAVTLELISTSGDERPDLAVPRLGTDGVFVRELEAALLDGRIDAAVHSLKDLPTSETTGLTLGCTPRRAIPFDVLVGRSAARIADLPHGAVVGTSSVRRRLQLRALRGDLEVRAARGNVDSRLRRLDAGEYDALVLAGAGLERLGLESRITEVLQPDAFWPAIAQGALVIQTRAGDGPTQSAVAVLHDVATHAAVVAERAFLAALAGGCLAPIGAWAHHDEEGLLQLGGCVLEERDGVVRRIVASRTAATGETPASVGHAVAQQLQAAGAEAMLKAARSAPGR